MCIWVYLISSDFHFAFFFYSKHTHTNEYRCYFNEEYYENRWSSKSFFFGYFFLLFLIRIENFLLFLLQPKNGNKKEFSFVAVNVSYILLFLIFIFIFNTKKSFEFFYILFFCVILFHFQFFFSLFDFIVLNNLKLSGSFVENIYRNTKQYWEGAMRKFEWFKNLSWKKKLLQ